MRVASSDMASFSLREEVSAQNVSFHEFFHNYKYLSEVRFKFEPGFRFITILCALCKLVH